MPTLPDIVARRAGISLEVDAPMLQPDRTLSPPSLVERVNIPYTSTLAPPGLIEAMTRDPFSQAGKYSLGWVYFCVVLLILTIAMRLYRTWIDKIRVAMQADDIFSPSSEIWSPETPLEMQNMDTDRSTNKLFPRKDPYDMATPVTKTESSLAVQPINHTIALFRYIIYRPIPDVRIRKGWRPLVFPSLSVILICFAALAFVTLYCFVPQPLYWQSIRFGSPPLAIRAGMLAVSMVPWLIALSMKANLITLITGIGHERLNVLHRWGGWLCLFLSLVHTIPFYIMPITDKGGYAVFRSFFNQGIYVYGTGMFEILL